MCASPVTHDNYIFFLCCIQELPAEPELDVKLGEQARLVEIGEVTSVVETLCKCELLLVVQAKC